MSQIQYVTITNSPLNTTLVDASGSALATVSGRLGVDVLTSSNNHVTTEDVETHYTGTGNRFAYINYAALASSATYDIVLSTPASPTVYIRWDGSASLSANLNVYEDTSATSGTSITVYNKLRSSATAPTVTMVTNPTVSVAGTKIAGHALENGRTEGSKVSSDLWILKPSTKYLFRFFSTNAQAGVIDFEFRWTEI